MKSIFTLTGKLLLILAIITSTSILCKGQDDDFKITVSTIDVSAKSAQDGSIQVQVDRADIQYEFMLFTADPWNGGKLIEKKKGDETATFYALKQGTYYLCVRNSKEVTRCQDIILK